MSSSRIPERDPAIRRVLTPAERLSQDMQNFASMSFRVGAMAVMIFPILLAGLLTIDMPVRFLNGPSFLTAGLNTVQWLRWGQLLLALVPCLSVLFARRVGGEEASRAIISAWFAVALFVLFELSILASVIEQGDFPSARFSIALVASAMTGQLVSVAFYNIARGGSPWWRAPFYSILAGFLITALIYFPIAYWGKGVPWAGWLVGDLMLKTLLALAFLPLYSILRRKIRPRGGYGGA